jgi:hypothetical protein
MSLNIAHTRELLEGFDFRKLFVEELGWSNPVTPKSTASESNGFSFERRQIAHLAGVVVFEIDAPDSSLPDAKTRAAISKEISKLHHENLLIFVDAPRTKSLWYWVKRDGAKTYPRDHLFVKGQPGDLFLSKLASMVVDISELDAKGNIPVSEVALRLKKALDVERVTKRFYLEFQEQHLAFLELIEGITDERQRRWYASVLLNRLMFIYFLQRKYFLDGGNTRYLQEKLEQSRKLGRDRYYSGFLNALFFEGFAKPEKERSAATKKLLGHIKYLNGGLFLPHKVEMENSKIRVTDKAFENLFALFERYSWNLDDTPGGNDDEINPDVLGYIFEKYINQKEFGAYYTRPEITSYLCEQTIYKLVLDKINAAIPPPPRQFASMPELLLNLDANLCRRLLYDALPSLSLLDPACGSGAFLVAAMKTLINLYSAIVGKIDFLHDRALTDWLAATRAAHPSLHYFIKKRIITDNLFGVDIMEEGAEIARLRLFLALVASAHSVEQLEPLPNIDFNILAGNSLIGLLKVDPQRFDAVGEKKSAGRQGLIRLSSKGSAAELPAFAVDSTVAPSRREKDAAYQAVLNAGKFATILKEKNQSIALYKKHAFIAEELEAGPQEDRLRILRDDIQRIHEESYPKLNQLLLDEFNALGIQFEQTTWDDAKNKQGKSIKRRLTLADIEALNPFHWGYEFDQIINERGGFDAIITNPPWEIFKPNPKEFFETYSELVSKKKMTIQDFEKAQSKLLKDTELRSAWVSYLSGFAHLSAYFRGALQYKNQISIINGKKAGSDVNLYKLFIEQSFNLLRREGRCGMITPGSIYTDLGSKQLREMLFSLGDWNVLFGLSNERFVFEGVHHAQKFCISAFGKGGETKSVEAAFRINPREAVAAEELDSFLHMEAHHLNIPISLVRRLSPDSLSIMEFRTPTDLEVAEKALRFPLLGQDVDGLPKVQLAREFDMTQGGAARLVKDRGGKGLAPLFEGKMIWQFDHEFADPKCWIKPSALRTFLLRRGADPNTPISGDSYRLVFRRQSASTNERTLVTTVLSPSFHADNLASISVFDAAGNRLVSNEFQLFLCGVLNSYVVDYSVRQRVTNNLNFFYIYQLPVPRLTEKDHAFAPIVARAAKLICTTPEFDDLAREVGLGSHAKGVTDPAARATLRAELDGLVAHLYGLTEKEFAHILATFLLVAQPVKDAALEAFRALAPKPGDPEIAALLVAGENANVEFKSSARWDLRENKKNAAMEQVILKTVAAFLNSEGGTLLLGVSDDGAVLGLEHDYQTLQKKNADGYELFLGDLLLTHYGKDLSRFLKFSFHDVDGKQVCRIVIEPAPRAVWVKEGNDEHLYARAGNSTRRLSTKEAIEYCKTRFKS